MNLQEFDPTQNENKDICFFAKLLQECSVQENVENDQMSIEPNLFESQCSHEDSKEVQPRNHWVWKEYDENQEELTQESQPQLVRAKSLRVEQQRKVSHFISLFNQETEQKVQYFSPQKTKRIGKGQKLKLK